MKIKRTLSWLLAAVMALGLLSGCGSTKSSDWGNEESYSMLLVGNSMLSVGRLNGQISDLANFGKINVYIKEVIKGGTPLSGLKEEALSEMGMDHYDYVVIQGSLWWGWIEETDGFESDFKEICDMAKATGSTVVLYSPPWWVQLDENEDLIMEHRFEDFLSENAPDVLEKLRLQGGLLPEDVLAEYERLAKENDAILINSWDAWVNAYQKYPDIQLLLDPPEDMVHPGETGSFLSACLFCAELFDMKIDAKTCSVYGDIIECDAGTLEKLAKLAWKYQTYYKKHGTYPEE